MLLYGVLVTTPSPEIVWAATAAAAACMIGVAAARYQPMSLVSIFCLMTMLSYPLAAFANLLLDEPAIRHDLWDDTELAMWGSVVGSLAIAAGAQLSRVRLDAAPRISKRATLSAIIYTSIAFNVALTSLLLVAVAAKVHLGVYYHSSVADYDFESTAYLNLLGYITLIAYCGMFLQLRRYFATRSALDATIALVLIALPVIAYLPSGSRESAAGHLPLFLLAYIAWEHRTRLKVAILVSGVTFLMLLIITVGLYRDLARIVGADLGQQTQIIAVTAREVTTGEAEAIAPQVIARISDYVATGRIISHTPDQRPFRMFSGMENWWQIGIPGFLRPKGNELYFSEGAVTTYEYGVSPGDWSSTPVMIVGDLFSRFGWPGVMAGMMLLGFLLRKIDTRFIAEPGIYGLIFFALFAGHTWRMYTASLLIVVVSLTRDLLLVYLLSRVVGWLAFKHAQREVVRPAGLRSRRLAA